MRMEIKYTGRFKNQYHKADKQIKPAFAQTLELFLEDPEHPALRNHALTEKYTGYRSIDVTGDWRALFKETHSGEQKIITFHMLGTHPQLYG